MVFQRAVLIEVAPRSWLVLAVVMLGFFVFIALLVLLLVTGSDYNDPTKQPPITHGPCDPFCTATPAPAVPR
ncbi:hypothetical protein [Nocardia wallacei]|uniref:Uncharacterized protein n=1 Tax=Nocardia wallacei TaxID=480035 RepID=A0A7G1KJE7_9NOCA|nr:hypothetical protein [Nocardia wallacei]BCK53464.1 hypothetical protein NWFMUON74_12360 [Nocardia wallacei]